MGDPEADVFLRSAAKPPQALPVVETGAADLFGLTPPEIAVMCGSLNGQDYQVAAVRSILDKIGLETDALDCGIHRPSHRPTAAAMSKEGQKPTELHNNCAGKHAAMLVLCVHHDWPIEGYTESHHPVQKLILNKVSEMTEVPAEKIGQGIDGCGVPVFALPLKNLALAYAKLAQASAHSQPYNTARLMSAMLEHPEMIAGDERICTEAMRAGRGRFLAKTGAEGTYALALPDNGWGVAFSIEDGHPRGVNPTVIEILVQLGQLKQEEASKLVTFHRPVIKNHRGQEVGFVEAVFDLKI
ncbi:MAG: asparaginase [Deltaproteobacteria bacterium]|nr:asparaginase [Deltaproteobacteria bacterium]